MTCRELVELLTEYLEGALPPQGAARVEQHLAACGACSAYLAQLRETIRLAGRLREDDLSPAARDQLLGAFHTWRQGPPGGSEA